MCQCQVYLSELLADKDPNGVPQLKFYDPGVGTHWYDRLSGGAFGAGLCVLCG